MITLIKNKSILKEKGKDSLLRQSVIDKIVIVVPDLMNYFYMDICRGIISKTQEHQIPCEILLSFESLEKEVAIFEQLKSYKRTGIIWAPSMNNYNIPKLDQCIILNIDREIDNKNIYLKILCNNIKASEQITELLFTKGIKKPSLITGNPHLLNAIEHTIGFTNILKKIWNL